MSNDERIVITGGGGMLAGALVRALKSRGKTPIALARRELDVTDEKGVRSHFANLRPSLLINAAGFTKVDQCEQETQTAMAVNGYAVERLAKLCRENGCRFVHYSTDFVFDGSKREQYTVEDAPNPQSAYGRSKLLGEKLAGSDALIIRTAWLYGPGGASFPGTMVDVARAGKPLRVVNNQIGSPTFTYDLADATLDLIDRDSRGVYHVTNSGQTSWFDFARAIFEEFGLTPDLQPITSADWKKVRPQSATRPAYSVLDLSRCEQTVGRKMRPWREGLREFKQLVEPNKS
jgi:dTDP-4-dehydrorhamnose reductase